MKPQTIGISATNFMAFAAKKNRNSDTGGAFDELFSRLSNTSTASGGAGSSASSAATSASASAAKTSSEPLSSGQTPAALFEQTIAASGTPANKVTMAGSDRSKLEELLSRSGYQDEDIKQILDQSTTADGSINLGMMFNVMHRYIPSEGPRFYLKIEDKPLLIQALKGLGVPEDDINKFMDGLEVQGGRLVVKGLPSLLAKAGQEKVSQGQEVDKSVLSDLLGKLGLSASEVSSLLEKASDNQDRINAKAVLAMLQKAANAQDGEVASYLKDLAQRTRLGSGQGQQQNTDANKLRAQFIKLFEHIEQSVQDQSLGLEEALASALKSGNKEGKAEEAAFRMVDNSLAQESDTQLESAAAATAQAETGGGMAQGGGQGNEAATQGRANAQTTQGQASAGPASDMARLSGEGQTGGARATLPTYVVRQVAEQMTQMVAKQQTSLNLQLKPPTLGELNVEISVKDGVVKATMVAESVAAKQALEAGMEQLKNQLASQGLKLERVEITINPDAQRQQAQAQEQERSGRDSRNPGGGGRNASGAGVEDIDLDGLAQASPGRGQSGFISVFA